MIVAIVDDEQHCIDHLVHLLQPHIGILEIVSFNTVSEAIKGIDELHPNIVFLDVQLHDKTGFDLLASVSYREFNLIFTTAYEKYAIEAFRFSAIAYLLKPVDREDFEYAFQKAMEKSEQAQLHERINVLLSNISTEHNPKRISVPHKDGYLFLVATDIIRCQADINYTHIFTSDGKKHTASKTLKHFEQLLVGHNFFRTHNSHLINLRYVTSYHRDGYALLDNGERLEVSTRRRESFIKACSLI
ncbi:response regulator [Flagellimonas olearia]|uniref:Response regulator n=1 Tax=Flagellimonas olearia TaxID=552546 RepID=A0A6I1E1M0_9FLAO|nr:LytTR family DNA-binding domain-containing protein [Allomuricauda olearia]KAB7530329.1 response regulator [Allomuricauda olearia]